MARTKKISRNAGRTFASRRRRHLRRPMTNATRRTFQTAINALVRNLNPGARRTITRRTRGTKSRIPAALRQLNSRVVENVQRTLAAEAAGMNTNNVQTRRSGRIAIKTIEKRAREAAEAERRAAEAAKVAEQRAAAAAARAAEAERRAAERAVVAERRAAETAAYDELANLMGKQMRMNINDEL